MSFTEWVLGSIIPLHPEDSADSNSRIRNNQDFQYLVNNVRSVIQFNHVVDYFLKHQQDEECADMFFHSKVLQKTLESGLKILEQNQEEFEKSENQDTPKLDDRVVEMCKALMALISSTRNQEHVNQMFSNNFIADFICGMFDCECSRLCLSESQEFHLLVKALALRLDSTNLALFMSGSPRCLPLFDTICQLQPSGDYHLNIIQRNVILIITRLVIEKGPAVELESAFTSLCIYLKNSMFQSQQTIDLMIDDCLYINDILQICVVAFPRIISVYYDLLPEHAGLEIAALAADLVHYYNETHIGKLLKFPIKNVYELLMLTCLMRNIIKHGDDMLLRAVHLLPSTKLYKKTLMTELLETESYQSRSPSTPIAISSKRNSANIEGIRRQESLSDLGPLDPSFNSLSLNEHVVKTDPVPETLSRSATPSRRHRKQRSEGYNETKIYETERVGEIGALLSRTPRNDETVIAQFACLVAINDLLDNRQLIKIGPLLNEEHRKYFRNATSVDDETAHLLLKGLDDQFPLIGDYNQLPFNEFFLKHYANLQSLKLMALESSSPENIHRILGEIFG